MNVKCPLCYSDNTHYMLSDGHLFEDEEKWSCFNCGVFFIPKTDSNEEYYLSGQFNNEFRTDMTASKILKDTVNGIHRAGITEKYITGKRVLEIGSSWGAYLYSIAPLSTSVAGIDPAPPMRNNGIVIDTFPSDKLENESYDVVCTFHTIEHTDDPGLFLDGIWNVLTENGILIVEYPDIEMASFRETMVHTYFQKSHIFDFSVCNMIPLLASHGFDIIELVGFRGFPRDKNVMIIARKTQPFEKELDRERINNVIERVYQKMDIEWPLNTH